MQTEKRLFGFTTSRVSVCRSVEPLLWSHAVHHDRGAWKKKDAHLMTVISQYARKRKGWRYYILLKDAVRVIYLLQ